MGSGGTGKARVGIVREGWREGDEGFGEKEERFGGGGGKD